MANSTNDVLVVSVDIRGEQKLLEPIEYMLAPHENIILAFQGVRDQLIITNKKILTVNKQGLTGKKVEYRVIPFSKISAFAVETAGTFDLDNELKIWASGIGYVEIKIMSVLVKTGVIKEIAIVLNDNII